MSEISNMTETVQIDKYYRLDKILETARLPERYDFIGIRDIPDLKGYYAFATDAKMITLLPVEGVSQHSVINTEAFKQYRKDEKDDGINPIIPDNTQQSIINSIPSIIPKQDREIKFCVILDAERLCRLAKALGSKGEVTLKFENEFDPIEVRPRSGSKAVGYLMPARMR